MTSFAREYKKNGSFLFQFRLSLPSWHNLLIIGLQTRENNRVHFSNIFSTLVAIPHFINGPFEIPEQLAVEKNS